MPTHYAILRFGKIKTTSALAKIERHNERTLVNAPLNVDRKRVAENVLIDGDRSIPLHERISNRIGKQKIRKNAVLAVEVFAGFSPGASVNIDAWKADTMHYIYDHFGRDNVVSAVLHMDEKTPHIQAVIVPIDTKGKLNCRSYLGGADKMIALQNDYAMRMHKHGLARGEPGSRRKHVPQKVVYTSQNLLENRLYEISNSAKSAIANAPIPDISMAHVLSPSKRANWQSDLRQTLQAATESATQSVTDEIAASTQNEAIAAATQQALHRMSEEQRRMESRYHQTAAKANEYAARLRDIPLPDVLTGMGYLIRQEGSSMVCDTAQGKIGIKGVKWFNYHEQHGGGGAIDLVMHLEECDYATALKHLAQTHGGETIGAVVTDAVRVGSRIVKDTPRASFQDLLTRYAQRDDAAWSRARDYLTSRGIPASQSDALHIQGLIWATHRGGVAFAHRSLASDEVCGATIRGISTQFKQTIGNRKSAYFHFGDPIREATKLYIAESPIDALSLHEIIPTKGAAYLSTAGAPDKDLCAHMPPTPEWILAFDSDEAGARFRNQLQAAAKKLGRRCQTMIPTLGKDWNDELMCRGSNNMTALPHETNISLNSMTNNQSIKYRS